MGLVVYLRTCFMMHYFNSISGTALPVQLSFHPLKPKFFADGSPDGGEAVEKCVINCHSKLNLAVVIRVAVKLSHNITSSFYVKTRSCAMFEGYC